MQIEGSTVLPYAAQNSFWVLSFDMRILTNITFQEITVPEIKRGKVTFGIGIDKSPVNFVKEIVLGDLVFKRLLIKGEADYFAKWITDLVPQKKNCSLKLYGQPKKNQNLPTLILTYEFEGCLPNTQKIGNLSKSGKEFLFEEITLSVDRMSITGEADKYSSFMKVAGQAGNNFSIETQGNFGNVA